MTKNDSTVTVCCVLIAAAMICFCITQMVSCDKHYVDKTGKHAPLLLPPQ